MLPIKNIEELLSVGNVPIRRCLLQIANTVLSELNSEKLIPTLMSIEGDTLYVGDNSWDLTKYNRILVIGAGKAVNHMARAAEYVLGDHISQGLVIAKQVEVGDDLQHIEIALGGHPYPNEDGWQATKRILEIVDTCGPNDLVLTLFSGGSSALMNCPVVGITVDEESHLTEDLLTAGANILEINTVRRHVSAVNGGRLAQRISSTGAQLINLVLSDRVGDNAVGSPRVPVAYTGTQIGLDPTTFKDAWMILERYNLIDKAPASVTNHLRMGPQLEETPKESLQGVTTFVIQGLKDSCAEALKAAEHEKIPAYVLTSFLEGDSRQAGFFLGSLAREIRCHQRPFKTPCILIAAGETTVRIEGAAGKGGPSQELAMAFAHQISGLKDIGIAAIETEGTDGPTNLAGAVTDDTTASRAAEARYCLLTTLNKHDTYPVLTTLKDHLLTGNTGTNLCDLNIVYIK